MPLPDYTSLVPGTSRASGFSGTGVADGSETSGNEIDNSSHLDELLDVECVYQYSSAPTANRTVELYILYALDGSNYPSRADGGVLIRAFSPPADTQSHRIPIGEFPLLPYKCKLHVRNVDTGQTISITLNARTRKATQIID